MLLTKPLSIIAAILLLTVVFAGLVTVPASAAQDNAVQSATLKYKGIAYVSIEPSDYTSTASHASLNAIQSTGANYVSVLVTQYVSSPTSNVIHPEPKLTQTDAAVTDAIRDIHARGMGVLLKPQIDCDYVLCGGQGSLAPSNPSAWFASYAIFINHYARIAQVNRVELFCVGCEYSNLDTSKYYANWRTVISGVRTIYHGPLTYGADYGSYARIPFWGLLDYAGIDAYFPLSDTKTPSVTALVNGWSHYVDQGGTHNWMRDIEVWQAKTHKKVVFSEIGYRSISYAAKSPGDWKESGAYNANGQANCYEAALRVFANKPWFAGMFWWGWWPDPHAGGAGDTGHTPQHKPAQGVLTTHWRSLGITFTIATSTTTPTTTVPFTLSGTLKSGTTPLTTRLINLERRTYSSGTWSAWANVAGTYKYTDAYGKIALSQTVSTAGIYQYRWHYNGNTTYQPAYSSALTVTVKKPITTTTLSASTTTPARSQSVTFTTVLKNGTTPLPSKSVTIYHYLNGVKYTDTTKTTNTAGHVTFAQTFSSGGLRTYYATFAGDSSYRASTSNVVTVEVP